MLGSRLKCYQHLREINMRTASVKQLLEGKSDLLLGQKREICETNASLCLEHMPQILSTQKARFKPMFRDL